MLKNLFISGFTRQALKDFCKNRQWLLRPTVNYLLDCYYTWSLFAHSYDRQTGRYIDNLPLPTPPEGQTKALQCYINNTNFADLQAEARRRGMSTQHLAESVLLLVISNYTSTNEEN